MRDREAVEPRRTQAPPSFERRSPLAALDDAQRAAVAAQGPLLIVAGPGSGKTCTLTHRIAHLVAERGVAPERCLAVTFTRRAAAELRERLALLLPGRADKVAIHTFHSLGLSILRGAPGAAGLAQGFRVAGEAERAEALVEALDVTRHRAEAILRAVSKAKRMGGDAEMLAAYSRVMAARNWIDFDDLVGLAVRALESDATLAAQHRLGAVAVDEFQDVDTQQYRLMRLLAAPGTDLCVIGDPDQAIYGFRGADAACFERFRQDHPEAQTVRLARNYRSSGTIVAAAAQVIGGEKAAAELVNAMQARITIHAAPTERAEAEQVVQAIEAMIGGHSFFSIDSGRAEGQAEAGLSFSDIAVLYRTEAQAAPLREALARSGMPFKQHGHAPLSAEPAVRALLRELEHTAGEGTLDVKLRAAADRLKAREDAPDAAAIVIAWQRLTALATSCGNDRARLVDAAALAGEADFFDPRAERVSLLTLHAAKGLEFRVVFIVGLEDGIVPLTFGGAPDAAALAEERRLFYVGMTRAKDRLVLSRAAQRLRRGALRRLDASPFLADIEQELVRHQEAAPFRCKPEDRQLKLL